MEKSCAWCVNFGKAWDDDHCFLCRFNKDVEHGNNRDMFEPTLSFIVEQIDEISGQINEINKELAK